MSTRREIVTLHGRVQMVGYRERVMEIASGRAVAGTVRNLRTGQLEIDVEGENDALDAFVDAVIALRPSLAHIEAVQRRPAILRGLSSFERAPTG